MRSIVKGHEPISLAQHRATPHSNYDNYQDKDTLRQYLVAEQRSICCYCLSRIRATANEMKVEHWHSQAGHPVEQLDYSNLLGTCLGNVGQPEADQYCDTYKGDKNLSRNPATAMHMIESLIHFEPDGRISSSDPSFNDELNSVLNLNVAFLVNSRRAALAAFKRTLVKRGTIPRSTWERLLRDWNGESNPSAELRPFCSVIVYWLRKRLRH
jgi:uncharacterized protein (TIGR02646 family)